MRWGGGGGADDTPWVPRLMCPGYYHKDSGNSWAHDVWFICPSTQVTYHKAIVMTNRKTHCFHGS